jgi:RimJ/RimL family protein N-acetyltransferase
MIPVTDGVVTIRPTSPPDRPILVAGRDEVFHRWLGPGAEEPNPSACLEVAGELVGWVDFDPEPSWLGPGEVNVGYNVLPGHRHLGYASRAVQLLMHHLATCTPVSAAVLVIDRQNRASLTLAARLGFPKVDERERNIWFRRAVPSVSYSDGVVSIRRPEADDLEADLSAKDEEQIRWMWLPEHREHWESMTEGQRRDHAVRGLEERRDQFGSGPKWTFSVDAPGQRYVAYVDCDLGNDHVAPGEANVSYSSHPDQRGNGHASRAVRLVLRFLADHTGCREAHIVADSENVASLRVARSVHAREEGRWTNDEGRTMIRHVVGVENERRRRSRS